MSKSRDSTKMTVNSLKMWLTDHDIDIPYGSKKPDLIRLREAHLVSLSPMLTTPDRFASFGGVLGPKITPSTSTSSSKKPSPHVANDFQSRRTRKKMTSSTFTTSEYPSQRSVDSTPTPLNSSFTGMEFSPQVKYSSPAYVSPKIIRALRHGSESPIEGLLVSPATLPISQGDPIRPSETPTIVLEDEVTSTFNRGYWYSIFTAMLGMVAYSLVAIVIPSPVTTFCDSQGTHSLECLPCPIHAVCFDGIIDHCNEPYASSSGGCSLPLEIVSAARSLLDYVVWHLEDIKGDSECLPGSFVTPHLLQSELETLALKSMIFQTLNEQHGDQWSQLYVFPEFQRQLKRTSRLQRTWTNGEPTFEATRGSWSSLVTCSAVKYTPQLLIILVLFAMTLVFYLNRRTKRNDESRLCRMTNAALENLIASGSKGLSSQSVKFALTDAAAGDPMSLRLVEQAYTRICSLPQVTECRIVTPDNVPTPWLRINT